MIEKVKLNEVAKDLNISGKDLTALLQQRFGGEAKKPQTVLSGEELVGGTGARLNLTSGSAQMQVVDMVPMVTLTSGSQANIPEGKEFFLMLFSMHCGLLIPRGLSVCIQEKRSVHDSSGLHPCGHAYWLLFVITFSHIGTRCMIILLLLTHSLLWLIFIILN